jgi:hypothetical protein
MSRLRSALNDFTAHGYPKETTITYYGRGTALWTPNQPDTTPPPDCPNLTLPELGCAQCYCEGIMPKGCELLPKGWCLNQNTRYKPIFSFTERFDASSPFATSLYEVAEPKLMQEQFSYTAALAKANGVTDGAVWPFVALGTGYRRCIKSAPNAGQTSVDLQCTHPVSSHYLGDYAVFDMTYDYDRADSALLGALINSPKYANSPTYGPWEQATAGYFYPSIFDDEGLASSTTNGSTLIVDHFISYVLGAAGMA